MCDKSDIESESHNNYWDKDESDFVKKEINNSFLSSQNNSDDEDDENEINIVNRDTIDVNMTIAMEVESNKNNLPHGTEAGGGQIIR